MKVTPVKKPFGKYQVGDVFELNDRLGRVFVSIGKLARADNPVTVTATVEPEVEISPRTGLPKRKYRNRSMESE